MTKIPACKFPLVKHVLNKCLTKPGENRDRNLQTVNTCTNFTYSGSVIFCAKMEKIGGKVTGLAILGQMWYTARNYKESGKRFLENFNESMKEFVASYRILKSKRFPRKIERIVASVAIGKL